MRKLILCILLAVTSGICLCQTPDEILRQKETQRKYLLRQIAAFRQYVKYLDKGYQIVKRGSEVISKIKKGDFDLHNDFFESLKNVNPLIRNSAKVAEIVAYQVIIQKLVKASLKSVMENEHL